MDVQSVFRLFLSSLYGQDMMPIRMVNEGFRVGIAIAHFPLLTKMSAANSQHHETDPCRDMRLLIHPPNKAVKMIPRVEDNPTSEFPLGSLSPKRTIWS